MTEAVLDTGPEKAHSVRREVPRSTWPLRACPECLTAFAPTQPGQLFCCREHKRAYNNRWLKRGAVLAPLFAAARMTRGGSRGDTQTGSKARRDTEQLVQRWKEEDEAAGRMSVVAYMAARYRLNLVDVV